MRRAYFLFKMQSPRIYNIVFKKNLSTDIFGKKNTPLKGGVFL